MHLCAQARNDIDSLMFLIEVCKLDIFERNAAGETVLSICEAKGYSEGAKTLEKKCQSLDSSHNKAQDIFAELEEEERKKKEKAEKARQKKLRQAATKRGMTVEEL